MEILTIIFVLILLVGIVFQIYWLATTSFGRTALLDSRPRRNQMPFYMPMIPLGVFLLLNGIAVEFFGHLKNSLNELEQNYLVLGCTGVIAVAILIITPFIVRKYFVRGFKGFGLDARTIGRDVIGAAVRLLTVWPLVLGLLWLTLIIGRVIVGPNFEISKHKELEVLIKYPYWWVQLTIVVFAVIVAPLYEEILFRGYIQTGLRNFTRGPWAATVFPSILFVIAHPNPVHWPALFVLSMGLGYAYEKSGSLFQSIFMHAIFNGTMTAATLLQQ